MLDDVVKLVVKLEGAVILGGGYFWGAVTFGSGSAFGGRLLLRWGGYFRDSMVPHVCCAWA